MIKYWVERHTRTEYIVMGQKDDEPLKMPIARCPTEGIALTVKGLYENSEQAEDAATAGYLEQLLEGKDVPD